MFVICIRLCCFPESRRQVSIYQLGDEAHVMLQNGDLSSDSDRHRSAIGHVLLYLIGVYILMCPCISENSLCNGTLKCIPHFTPEISACLYMNVIQRCLCHSQTIAYHPNVNWSTDSHLLVVTPQNFS